MSKALTVKTLEALKPKGARQEIPDGGLSGLYIIVQPSGATSWAIRYRIDSKPKKFTIGPYPAFGLAEAREAARKALRDVSEGRDPAAEKVLRKAAEKEQQAEAPSTLVKDVLDDFVKRHVDKKNRPTTARENKRIIEKEIKPKWGERDIASITRANVLKLLDEIAERGPTLANRVLALLRKFFNWCVNKDILAASPMAKKIEAPSAETTRERVLADAEIRLLWKACNNVGWPFGSLVKLLLLTAQRRKEVANAERKEFDVVGNDQIWIIPRTRTKNKKEHYVPLAAVVLEAINEIPETKSIYLLSTTETTPVSGFSKGKKAIDAEMLKIAREEVKKLGEEPEAVSIERWTLHDLRRTAASGMARLGVPVHVVEAVINHRSGSIKGVAAVYNRYDYAEEKRAALIAWANHVMELTAGSVDALTPLPQISGGK
ncbi:site-specific integrase [Rhizobium sp. N4311]|uniref:tyrosine-type recombinase/integrase n=1 Tax=Rhizobium sp. N4311 TaxID=1703972 RepID=UPI000B9706FB|nr:site-specific integrase [Rhizobium sp. N4311]OYD03747.1 integrase/recombinase family protein [Rhizobium sp. N4311]